MVRLGYVLVAWGPCLQLRGSGGSRLDVRGSARRTSARSAAPHSRRRLRARPRCRSSKRGRRPAACKPSQYDTATCNHPFLAVRRQPGCTCASAGSNGSAPDGGPTAQCVPAKAPLPLVFVGIVPAATPHCAAAAIVSRTARAAVTDCPPGRPPARPPARRPARPPAPPPGRPHAQCYPVLCCMLSRVIDAMLRG